MSKINSIGGLNTVPVDFRPEIAPVAQNNAPAESESQLAVDELDEAEILPRASGIVRELVGEYGLKVER